MTKQQNVEMKLLPCKSLTAQNVFEEQQKTIESLSPKSSVDETEFTYYTLISNAILNNQEKINLLRKMARQINMSLRGIRYNKNLPEVQEIFEQFFKVVDIENSATADRKRFVYGSRKAYCGQVLNIITDLSLLNLEGEAGKEQKRFLAAKYDFNLDEDKFKGSHTLNVERQDGGILSEHGHAKIQEQGIGYISKETGVNGITVENYSDEILTVNCFHADLNNKEYGVNNILQWLLLTKRIYRIANGATATFVRPVYDKNTKRLIGYTDVGNRDNEILVSLETMAKYKNLKQVTPYWILNASPSAARKKSVLMLKVEEDTYEAYDKKYRDMINDVSYGTYDVLHNAYGYTPLLFGKAAKLSSRLTLAFTGSVKGGEIKAIAIYCGSFKTAEGVEYSDGHGFVNANVIRKHYLELHPEADLTEKDFCYNAYQARFGAVKGNHTSIPAAAMKLLIEETIKISGNDPVFFPKKEINAKLLKKIQLGEYDGHVLIIGADNLENVDFFGDSSVYKAIFDFSVESFEFSVMEQNNNFKDDANLSIQYLSGLMSDPRFIPVIAEILKENMDEQLEDFKLNFNPDGTLDPQKLEPKTLEQIHELEQITYPNDTIFSINKGMAFADSYLLKLLFKQKVNSLNEKINRMYFGAKGIYGKVVPDYGLFFQVSLLKNDEIYIGDQRYKNKYGDMIRYPHNNFGEHFCCKSISFKMIKLRIVALYEAGKINKSVMDFLIDLYKNLNPGIIVVPSGNPLFARLLGGADYDGDGVIVFFDRRIMKLAVHIPMRAIEFGKPPKAQRTVLFDTNLKDTVYYTALEQANEDVGVATNRNMMAVALVNMIRKGIYTSETHEQVLAKLYDIVDREKTSERTLAIRRLISGNGKYERRYGEKDFYIIDSAEVDNYIHAVEKAGINSLENFYNILKDLQHIYASVIGRLIDSAKTLEAVVSPLKVLGSILKAGMIQNIKINVEENPENGKLVFNAPTLIETGFVGKGKFVTADPITSLKNKCASYVTNKLKEMYETIDKLNNVPTFKGGTSFAKEQIEAAKWLAKICSGIHYSHKESYGYVKEYVVDFLRNLTRNISYESRYDLVKAASLIQTNGGETYGRFYLNFGVEAVLQALNGNNFMLYEKLYSYNSKHSFSIGEKITLEDGTNDKYYVKPHISGDFTVTRWNGSPAISIDAQSFVKSFDRKESKLAVALKVNGSEPNKLIQVIHKAVACGFELFFNADSKYGDILLGYDKENDKAYYLADLYLPGHFEQNPKTKRNVWVADGAEFIGAYINGKKFNFRSVEIYSGKNSDKKVYAAIFGTFTDEIMPSHILKDIPTKNERKGRVSKSQRTIK